MVPQLENLDIGQVIAAAGGDPWAVDTSLQRGRPNQISDLALAFHNAGRCTTESSKAFEEARNRFEASWNRENGNHPINDSAEVQRATQSLGVQADKLPKIGTDLENIAAKLAETQRISATQISSLDAQLKDIDGALGHLLHDPHNPEDTAAIQQRINDLINLADADTKSTLGTLESLRDGYTDNLEKAVTSLRVDDGYDPSPIQGIDDDGKSSHDEHDQNAVKNYDAKQRQLDQALVDSPGGMTPEKADAAARLRDYAIATNPAASLDARRLASERLDDFALAHFTGPLPTDRVLGGDARTRAQMRLELQKKLEQGILGGPQMSPDQATQLLDDSEQHARAFVMQQAVKGLEWQGMSPSAAKAVARGVEQGIPWAEMVKQDGQIVTLTGAGVDGAVAARGGRHAVDAFTPQDVKVFERIGKSLDAGGTVIEVGLATNDLMNGAPVGQTLGKLGGSIGGGWAGSAAGGALAGTFIGPEGAIFGAIIGAAFGAWTGENLGGTLGGQLDK
ncbi:hypothetical protein MRAB57_4224 [Mycobacterium rhizamassiliense]|jgi:hypothetical protein|uniref:Predicted hydrolase N-terminal domain-containing protein n=1 Tax=Mycobacterium rhizamassiliense TaxID=1841860 RepID=A0A2U3NY35_9MYCO|nr:hypothetical protein [Mycobacterium rhizamassiliense]SPM36383.1 hypothetical protein MRAB57_4224 [Mycobacterium rhizamassiliense]